MAIGKQPDVAAVDEAADDNDSIFAEINITPLTDVFLVMVIIFMVSALAVQAEANLEKREEQKEKKQKEDEAKLGLNLQLPSGQSAEIDVGARSLILDIPKDGDVYVSGGPGGPQKVTQGQLDLMLKKAYALDKKTQVILRADKGVPHGRVVQVMEQAKQAGLSKLAIGTGK
jgi:biopolymer transport protein ExbD